MSTADAEGKELLATLEIARPGDPESTPAPRTSCSSSGTRSARPCGPRRRGHPSAPDDPLHRLLTAGTGLVDRARDLLTGRGRG